MPAEWTDLCSTALFFECTAGRGRLVHSFAVSIRKGKLLGLMAVHLVLLGISQLLPGLRGKVVMYSDCDSALQKVEGLPLLQNLLQCKHADILKNILVNCTLLSFSVEFKHICTMPSRLASHRPVRDFCWN
jgi:hypothetical protein